jgi:general L-amino acid transport system permease protein
VERADEAGLEAEAPTLAGLARRFWPLILGVVVILQFTETWGPTLLTIGALAAGILARYVGLMLPRAARSWVPLAFTVGIILSFRVVISSGGSGFSLTEVVIVGAAIGLAAFRREWRAIVWIVVLVATMHVPIAEGGVGLDDWGGLQLSLLLAATGIILAFPIGILLALGRRSSLAGVRTVSIGFIEFIRGVPLITLLLAASFFLGFFLPVGSETPSLVGRSIVVITLFSGAYIAEIIRGGLQAVPRGQAEAAQALGLSPIQVSRLVVMPQALRAVMPAMVGQFISLFKDTSLVVIIGLTDLLRFSELANAQPQFAGRELGAITLTFVGFIYWVGSYTMSRESRRLEETLGVGER